MLRCARHRRSVQLMRVVRCAHYVKRTFGEALVEIGDVMSGIVVIIDGEVRRSATCAVRQARSCHICTADWAHPAAASASGLGSPRPHLHRDWGALSSVSCS